MKANFRRAHRKLRWAAVAFTATAALCSGLVLQPADAATTAAAKVAPPTRPSYVSAEVWQKMMAQQPAVAAASAMQSAIAESKDADGFTGISLGDSSVDLYWKGPVPESVSGLVADIRSHTCVKLHAANYSRKELAAASAQILEHEKKLPGRADS